MMMRIMKAQVSTYKMRFLTMSFKLTLFVAFMFSLAVYCLASLLIHSFNILDIMK